LVFVGETSDTWTNIGLAVASCSAKNSNTFLSGRAVAALAHPQSAPNHLSLRELSILYFTAKIQRESDSS